MAFLITKIKRKYKMVNYCEIKLQIKYIYKKYLKNKILK